MMRIHALCHDRQYGTRVCGLRRIVMLPTLRCVPHPSPNRLLFGSCMFHLNPTWPICFKFRYKSEIISAGPQCMTPLLPLPPFSPAGPFSYTSGGVGCSRWYSGSRCALLLNKT